MITIRTVAAGRGIAWFVEGFDYFSKSAAAWLGIVLVLFVGFCASSFVPMTGVILQIIMPVLTGGLMLGCRETADGGRLRLDHLFAGFRQNTGELLLLGVFYTIGTLVIMAIMVMLLMMVAGMTIVTAIIDGSPELLVQHMQGLLIVLLIGMMLSVPLLMAFWFGPALVMLEGQSAINSMKYSFNGCLKNMLAFLVYGLAGMVLALLATVPFMLGWLVLAPVTIAGIYIAYRDIYGSAHDALPGRPV